VQLSEALRNNVKEKLERNEVVSSMTVRLVRGIEIVRIASSAGFDSLYVDLEHSSLTLDDTGQICMAAMAMGIAAFVRVPANTPEYISRVLDGGALGVIAPNVRTAQEAGAVVAAAKYPPLGRRGASGGLPHLNYRSFPAGEANAAMNDATMVIIQFESAEAIDRAEEIAAVEGVDLIMIGTNDFLAEIGIPGQFEHERVRDAYVRTIAAARKHGKHVGVGGLPSRPKLIAEFVKLGARYVSTGTDLAFLVAEASQRARQVREIEL
jgi:4-hydroxy-2-oxoheptanedioate aldolase